MGSSYTFEGWLAHDKSSVEGKMVWGPYEPKTWDENDIDIQIECCGICGSDIHTLRSGWGPTNYPMVVGHEIVGKAVRVGSKAEGNIQVGDRVGVGAQAASCLKPDCEQCSHGDEPYCTRQHVDTFNGVYPDGSKSYGGYALYSRTPSHFVFKLPDVLPSNEVAPMLCGGVTVYNPLKANGCGPGKRVGIVGVGGLGHFGLLFAKALGADEVVAISRTGAKKADALKMGASRFIATDEDKDWATEHASSLDLIVSTVSSPNMPFAEYLQLLRVKGTFIQVGAPEDVIPAFHAFSLIGKGIKVGGSLIGGRPAIEEMLDVAAKHKVRPWINACPMKEANQAVVDFNKNLPRYRYVLVNEDQGGKVVSTA